MDNEKMDLAVWTGKCNEMIFEAKKVYKELGISAENLPDGIFDGEKPISLVFAGQYSAGKSTIIKALTGISSIEIGEGITTQEAHSYDWNGMTVVDTPGICTVLRPDHDEVSYKAIADADMLVYIVTHNLFDELIGTDFRKLIIDNDKAKETILIVNKMADVGNSEEMRTIKLEDLKKVTQPYSPEELRTCFIDAESYIESEEETDDEIRNELVDRSNYTGLVDTINKFVEEKQLSIRLTTSLYRLLDTIQSDMTQYLPSSGDDDVDALEETQLRQKSIFNNALKKIEYEVRSIYRDASSSIREIGRNAANEFEGFSSQEEADNYMKDAQNQVDDISHKCEKDIEDAIKRILEECEAELEEYYKSPFIKKVYDRLSKKNLKDLPLIQKIVDSEVLAKGGEAIVQNAGGKIGLKGLSGLSGTNVHQMVLNVGHFFNHSFKPWEAVKITKGINVFGKVLGALGIVLSVGMQAKSDHDEEQRVKELKENREKIRAIFNSVAEELEDYYMKSLNEYTRASIMPRIEQIDQSILDIRQLRIGKTENCQKMAHLEEHCRGLISEIHESEF
ncbi:MAG: 50S ribosome-binding GTPase [Lachnospiraceae bacterium]|nr:50S ribosome-binding GTPase [Lachnospiraceae bacterium]